MFILVNLKAYPCDAVDVAEAVADVAAESGARITVAPQAARLSSVAATGVETWAQHVSPVGHGSHTGSTLAEAVADAGAAGTLLNHSERRIKLADVDGSLAAARRTGLETVVCANNPDQAAAAAALGPDAVAVEPPELIGGDVSVASADPAIVEDSAAAVAAVDEDVELFCGAGVSNGEDVAAAADLGASGVLLASGVAKADDPRAVLRDLVSGI
ncbi:triose-phosphate isomerase [Halorarum halobium]|uniref:triose-phosphate isomerase n=1 Tax=Halorarum halobium TaxID=3075121 RepID=UPI0028AED8B4|nr:triose-phosphate isomerase [Halobaculum sp. XH14]